MPSYIYQCSNLNCNEEKTIDCKMSEYTPTTICEKCSAIMNRKPENMVAGYQCNVQGFYGKSSK